ncbi:enolase C-terminal domain-like protein [Magnetospirillum sp. 15-1]|uniref:enolase C-terminal domain-like protein n=1 Tax=Magnetospirillum sp. 15-1 TaxID=1979370 RepID=UPI000BBC3AB3|nr:enolase C-terminal domain-like protein [Magnetospirillum sp. 15-1]
MIITGLTARAVNVPLDYPVRTSVGTVATAPLVLIDIGTDRGIVGRSYVFTYTPLALAAVRELLSALGEALAGYPAAPAEIDRLLEGRFRLLGATGLVRMAMAGIDMALWDAAAHHLGVPLVEMLGGTRRPIPAYDSHSMDGETLAVERAKQAAGQGFTAIKTKIGYATLAEDIRVIRAIRAAIGDGVQILVDYNQSQSVPEAIRRGKALESEGVAWIEEPTRQEDYLGHARIREALALPVQMGENWFGIDEMTWALDAGATDLAMPDAMKIGGVTGWLRAAALAQSRGIPMSSHIFQEVSCHLMAVTPTAHLLERMDLAAPILDRPLRFEAGSALIPDRPGTGIGWNEAAVERYAV